MKHVARRGRLLPMHRDVLKFVLEERGRGDLIATYPDLSIFSNMAWRLRLKYLWSPQACLELQQLRFPNLSLLTAFLRRGADSCCSRIFGFGRSPNSVATAGPRRPETV